MTEKVTIVGESNPYGSDPYYAMYPVPDGSAGHRLCCLILGMKRKTYIDSFHRVNLVDGGWSIVRARKKASELKGRLILCGSKVCSAFGLEFKPFTVKGKRLILPHPSGLCRLWYEPDAIDKARRVVREFAPELSEMIGVEND